MKKITQTYRGGVADSCWAYAVGQVSEEVQNLMDVTKGMFVPLVLSKPLLAIVSVILARPFKKYGRSWLRCCS